MTTVDIKLSTPDVDRLGDVVRTLHDWQRDTAPIQLHPGDLGWHWRFGAAATAAAVRIWSRDGQLLAIGLLDGRDLLRMTVAPDAWRDEELAGQVVADAAEPERGVLPAGPVGVEAPDGTRVQDLFAETGWSRGQPWTPLRRDLAGPVEQPRLRITVVAQGQEPAFTAVHRSAWGSQRFTDEAWRVMTTGWSFAEARCLLAYDDQDVPVAGVTVWSAGPGKPGLIEPMGVHVEHRRRGYGRAICVAAAAELQRLGSSSVLVCTESVRTAAVATYRSAGFQQLPERLDLSRDS